MKIHGLEFHNKLSVDPILSGDYEDWEMTDWYAVTFFIDQDPTHYLIFVPRFYITDFGSIPKFAWSIVGGPATGRHKRGTIFHDWVFTMHSASQKFADAMLLAIMKYDKTELWKRRVIYWAVRTGGQLAWWRWKEKRMVAQYRKYHKDQLRLIPELSGYKVYA